MVNVALVVAAVCSLMAASPQQVPKEDELVWKTVEITLGDSPETGRLALSASSDKDGLTSLAVTAFGWTATLTPEQLEKVRGFPLGSLRVTREAHGDKGGGPAIHFRLQREYYDTVKQLLLTREEAVMSVTRSGIIVTVGPQAKK